MNEFLKAFPILHADLRLLEKGQPARDQLPTVGKTLRTAERIELDSL
jgi:hypothetical protein